MNNVNVGYFNGVKQQHYLQLRVDRFCESVFLAAEEWDESVSDETRVQDTKKSLLVIHNPGAQIGGVTWR